MKSFKIPVIPSTTPKTIRFPDPTIERIEKAIRGKNSTFSAFVVAATHKALDELENKFED